jgi:hypothetical protein
MQWVLVWVCVELEFKVPPRLEEWWVGDVHVVRLQLDVNLGGIENHLLRHLCRREGRGDMTNTVEGDGKFR